MQGWFAVASARVRSWACPVKYEGRAVRGFVSRTTPPSSSHSAGRPGSESMVRACHLRHGSGSEQEKDYRKRLQEKEYRKRRAGTGKANLSKLSATFSALG